MARGLSPAVRRGRRAERCLGRRGAVRCSGVRSCGRGSYCGARRAFRQGTAIAALAPQTPGNAVQIARPLLAQGGRQAGGNAGRLGAFFLDDGLRLGGFHGSASSTRGSRDLHRFPPRPPAPVALFGLTFRTKLIRRLSFDGRLTAMVSSTAMVPFNLDGLLSFDCDRLGGRFGQWFGRSLQLHRLLVQVSGTGPSSTGFSSALDGWEAGSARFRFPPSACGVCLAKVSPGSTKNSSSPVTGCGAAGGSEGTSGASGGRLAGAGAPPGRGEKYLESGRPRPPPFCPRRRRERRPRRSRSSRRGSGIGTALPVAGPGGSPQPSRPRVRAPPRSGAAGTLAGAGAAQAAAARHCALRNAVQLEDLLLHAGHDLVVLLVVLEEIRNIEERIAVQADIDERRLHARQHPRHPAFVDASRQRIFVFALMINFDYLIVFDDRHACFVAVGGDHQFL